MNSQLPNTGQSGDLGLGIWRGGLDQHHSKLGSRQFPSFVLEFLTDGEDAMLAEMMQLLMPQDVLPVSGWGFIGV